MTDLKALATRIVQQSLDAGADAAEVYLRQGHETEIEVRDGHIDKLVEGGLRSVGLRLWRGDRSASTYGTDLSDATIARLITDTLDLAPLTDPVPELALPERDLLATSFPDLDLFDDALSSLSADARLDAARATEAAAIEHDPRITASGGAGWSDGAVHHALANSHGFANDWRETWASLHVEAVADDEGGKKRNGSWYSVARFADALEAPETIGRIAGERAVRSLGAGPVPTRSLPVVFDPLMAASLLGTLFGVMTGSAVERASSFLVGRIGETIASPLVTVVDDPLRPRALGSRPHDGEGLPATRTTFVDAGRLITWAHNCYTARKLGDTPTGHASRPSSGRPGIRPSNLYLAAGDRSPEDIIGEIDFGFFCDGMMGFGFNAVTGDFSRGASGFLIENGKLTRPVSEVTLSLNFGDILTNIDAIGNDLRFDRGVVAPTIRVTKMTLAGR